jgi:hypothetical protein
MSREVRRLIVAEGLLLALVGCMYLLWHGCGYYVTPCRPYLGDAPLPHDGTPTLSVRRHGDELSLGATAPLVNPTNTSMTAAVKCEWRLDGEPVCSRQAQGIRVCARSSVAVDLACLTVAPQGQKVALRCASSWH